MYLCVFAQYCVKITIGLDDSRLFPLPQDSLT